MPFKNIQFIQHDFVNYENFIQTYLRFPIILLDVKETSAKGIALNIIKEFKRIIESNGMYNLFLGKTKKFLKKIVNAYFIYFQ